MANGTNSAPSSSRNWHIPQDKVRIALVVLVFFLILFSYSLNLFERLELVSLDYRFFMRADRKVRPDIVVIEISDDSVHKIGRWPWDRDWHATMIKILKESGAKAIAFDILFSEKSVPEKDQVLSLAMKEAGNVYLPVVADASNPVRIKQVIKSLPEFTKYEKGEGHINLKPDADGVMRRIPLFFDVAGERVPQMGLKIALDELDVKTKDIKFEKNKIRIQPFRGKKITIPLDDKGEFLIDWKGKWPEVFQHVSYFDVISSYVALKKGEKPEIPLDFFKDKLCLIGGTATALFDIQPIPLEPVYPGIGVNLHILNNILERKFILPVSRTGNTIILVVVALLLALIVRIESYFKSALFCTGVAFAYAVGAIAFFVWFGVWINMAYTLMLILATYVAITLYNQLSITFERSKLFQLATRDPLTGLYNIGHFRLLFKAELAALAAGRIKKLSIVMGDVDLFKKVNDTYGHVTGDQVLKEVGHIVKSNSRALDLAARYGGEEFILLLPSASSQEAFRVAEKIRKALMDKTFSHEKGDFHATISLGISEVAAGEENLEKIIQKADTALYLAKHRGRNRSVISGDTPGYFPHPIEYESKESSG